MSNIKFEYSGDSQGGSKCLLFFKSLTSYVCIADGEMFMQPILTSSSFLCKPKYEQAEM